MTQDDYNVVQSTPYLDWQVVSRTSYTNKEDAEKARDKILENQKIRKKWDIQQEIIDRRNGSTKAPDNNTHAKPVVQLLIEARETIKKLESDLVWKEQLRLNLEEERDIYQDKLVEQYEKEEKFNQLKEALEKANQFYIDEINRLYGLDPKIDTSQINLIHLVLQKILDGVK